MRITRKKSIELLKTISEDIVTLIDNKIKINNGGCGIFAERLYYFIQDIGLKPKIVLVTRFDKDFVKTELNTKDENNNVRLDRVPFSHIMICVNGYLIDSHGMYKRLEDCSAYNHHAYAVVYGTTLEMLRYWNKQTNGWNPSFNRKVGIPIIRNGIKKIKKDLELTN